MSADAQQGTELDRTKRLELIARVGQRIAARHNPDELFSTTVDELHLRLGYDHVSLFLLDLDDPTCLVQRARASFWPRRSGAVYQQSVSQGVIGAAARQRAAQLVNDVRADPRYVAVAGADDLQAELAVPILLGERLLGVLDVASRQRFQPDDVTAIGIVADQLAVAIDNAQLFADTAQVLQETRLLYETSQRIGMAQGIDEVIAAYLEQVAARGRYICTIALYAWDQWGGRAAVVIRGRWTPDAGISVVEERVPYARDELDPLLDAGETVAIADVHADPRVPPSLRALQSQSGRPALALIPLMAHVGRIGLVILSCPHAYQWCATDLQPFQATAAQLAIAIDNRRQQALLYQRGQQVAVLEERQRLARELHDSVTQHLFSITLISQSLATAWRRDPPEGERRVERLLELSQTALAEMRDLLAELRPAEPVMQPVVGERVLAASARLRRDGLVAALRWHVADLARDGLELMLHSDEYIPQPFGQEEALYRIAQEALANIVKHAQARQVMIWLRTTAMATELSVKDDGVGFVLDSSEQAHTVRRQRHAGLGLRNMDERTAAFGGTLQVFSVPGSGTTIAVVIPVK